MGIPRLPQAPPKSSPRPHPAQISAAVAPDRALADKAAKYDDLPTAPVVVAADAVSGVLLPDTEAIVGALVAAALLRPEAADAFVAFVAAALVVRAAAPLRDAAQKPRRRAFSAPKRTRRERRAAKEDT